MVISLRSRLTWTYIFFAIICIAIISILANITLERQFRSYIKANIVKTNLQIKKGIIQQYQTGRGWNTHAIEQIGVQSLERGLIITVHDMEGRTLWDARAYDYRLCEQMIEHMSKNMNSRYPGWQGSYMENRFDLMKNNKTIGTMSIGYYGPFFLTDTDLLFINTLNHILLGVTLFALLFALILGAVTAKRLSDPIADAINAAEAIAEGNYRSEYSTSSRVIELQRLGSTMQRLADVLQNQESLRKRLTADVAHELRTPLATLQSHMEAMMDGVWEMDKKRLEVCHGEILRIQRIVQDLSRLSKYESEPMQFSRFDLTQLIHNIISSFEVETVNNGIKLSFQTTNSIFIDGDRDRLSQVVINLLSNAQKYARPGGVVTIGLSETDATVELEVKDNGIGIDPSDLPYIFERFYRADRSRNRLTGGSGIGLTISKAIVEAHGGTIKVQSILGEGTQVMVCLPKRQSSSANSC